MKTNTQKTDNPCLHCQFAFMRNCPRHGTENLESKMDDASDDRDIEWQEREVILPIFN